MIIIYALYYISKSYDDISKILINAIIYFDEIFQYDYISSKILKNNYYCHLKSYPIPYIIAKVNQTLVIKE